MFQDRPHHYVEGRWVEPVDPRPLAVENPATERAIATVALGGPRDVDRAVAAARAAFEPWRAASVEERAALLKRIRDIYIRCREEFAQAMTAEMGVPITLSRDFQAPCGDGHLQATIEALRAHAFERPSPRGASLLRDEPVGVCGLITPWNWPVNQVIVKVAPALAAGCTVILKPAELAPLSAALLAEVIDEAGAPPGVFNLVQGDGMSVGAPLAGHRDIDMVSFTGSTRAGAAVAAAAAPNVTRVALELGGKSPNILFADADLDAAVPFSVERCFSNSGQDCDAPSRLLVERAVYDEVVERAAAHAKAMMIGDPAEAGDHLGPVVSGAQWARIQDLIETGLAEGARLVAGGPGKPDGLPVGHFVRPTVFADVANDMRIAREEIFGPVLAIIPFDTEDEAVTIAEDTPYGLAAFVQSSDLDRARRVARRLRAGTVSINGAAYDYDVPFGGFKRSGYGRENGAHGLEDYLDVKAITAP